MKTLWPAKLKLSQQYIDLIAQVSLIANLGLFLLALHFYLSPDLTLTAHFPPSSVRVELPPIPHAVHKRASTPAPHTVVLMCGRSEDSQYYVSASCESRHLSRFLLFCGRPQTDPSSPIPDIPAKDTSLTALTAPTTD